MLEPYSDLCFGSVKEHKDDRFDCFKEKLDKTFSEAIDKYFHLEIKDFLIIGI